MEQDLQEAEERLQERIEAFNALLREPQ
jgi:hypothetical protein